MKALQASRRRDEIEPSERPIASLREPRRREGRDAQPTRVSRRTSARPSAWQLLRVGLLLVAGLACAAGLRSGTAKAGEASESADKGCSASRGMVNSNR